MSSIANISSAAQALPQVNIHPHGHRHGGHVKSTDSTDDSSSDAAAPVPAGTQQSLFGTLLSSLEQVIGLQPASTAAPAPASPVSASAGTPASPGGAAAPTNAAAANANNTATLLQNYLSNLSQTVNGSSAAKAAGVHVNA